MKKIKLSNKLNLNKTIVSNLNAEEAAKIVGGEDRTYPTICGKTYDKYCDKTYKYCNSKVICIRTFKDFCK